MTRQIPFPSATSYTWVTPPTELAPLTPAKPLLSPVEREALARLGESLRVASHGIADGLASLSEAVIRAGEALATFTATVKAEGDDE